MRAPAIALAMAAFTAPMAAAEDPAETLRLTRLTGSEPAARFSVATPDGGALALGDFRSKVVLLNL